MVANALFGALVAGAGVLMSVVSLPYVGIPAVAGGFVAAIFTMFLSRRTAEGQRLLLAWKAFRSHLKSIGRALGPVTLHSNEWGRYLTAAIVFGFHKKLMPNLVLEGERGTGVGPVWFYAHGGAGDLGLGGLASGLSTMVDTVSTTMSSAAGTGGGASGGGGGGSGGGGGGAG